VLDMDGVITAICVTLMYTADYRSRRQITLMRKARSTGHTILGDELTGSHDHPVQIAPMPVIYREFEFYEFFSFSKFNEFYDFFSVEKKSQKIRNFANHRCLTCFDVLECNVHL